MGDKTPDLERSIRTIKTFQRDIFQQSSGKEIADMYTAAIALIYYLKVDQEVLQRTRDAAESEKKIPKCPAPAEIPAINAVVRDSQVFTALLQCLSPSAAPPSFEAEASIPATGGGRKRSLSFSNNEVTSNKFMKTTHSPNPVGRKLVDHAVMPHYSLATLAATILYASFAHLDHWPPSLVKAYADDVFGPRLWIDDANCRLLVQNLELCHRSSVIPTTSEEGMAQAAMVSEAYQELSVSSPTISRGSVSSYGSSQEQGKRKRGESGNSSSSGEEDEEIELTAKGGSNKATRGREISSYPVNQTNLDLESVRPRYFGVNFEVAVDRIASSLFERLDVKSKQNSGLLQALPMFVSIPKVRSLIASNLSKWLQSPALAGLARTLFSATVNHMKHEDPPLPDDLLAIDSILAMRLKANQLNTHVENITEIAKRIPTLNVVRRMYSKLLHDEIEVLSSPTHASTESTRPVKMVGAIHAVVPAQVSYDAIASSFLMMMARDLEDVNDANKGLASGRVRLILKLRRILRRFAAEISSSFDGVQLMKSFFEFDVNSQGWSFRNAEDKARLMFQCVTLAVSSFVRGKGKASLSETEELSLRASLLSVRKLLLSWFCTYYGPYYSSTLSERINAKGDKEFVGAGLPNFRSTLGQFEEETIPSWLNTLRCLLFIEEPESGSMREFNLPSEAAPSNECTKEWEAEIDAVRLCCKYGADVNDDLIWIVLEASREDEEGLEPQMSLQIIENLLRSCSKDREGKVRVNDPSLVWEMYNLAQYKPPIEANPPVNLPRLALPGNWWRATVVSLVFCSASGKIADVMWKEHPTLQSIMKMVTSSKYRFPTVDCDDVGRDKMKSAEQKAREEETSIAEQLFLPPIFMEEDSTKTGSRISKRLLKQQKDKDAARLLEERTRRKKMLKSAQKSIMLWDPDGPARKPPREVAELIIAVDNAFELSDEFQKSTDPDFLTMTIGNTTRNAVERAYDWLIPIVSKFPEIISRLHSSTSCFLLLRAHGNDGDEKKELWDLAAPLLRHVQQSLEGKFGTGETVKAFELLISDIASHNPDRRRCARRVLQESLPACIDASTSSGSWMRSILLLKDASYILPDAVKYMATAASFERGSVLRSLIVSLQQIIEYSEKNVIDVSFRFADLVVDLISKRPSVLAEAIDSYTDLRSIIIKVIFEEFSTRVQTSDESKITQDFDQSMVDRDYIQGISLSLVQSISVFLSLWKDEFRTAEGDSSKYIDYLADALLHQHSEGDNEKDVDVLLDDTKTSLKKNITVPVELWIMLAKARSDAIARRAALSAPASFLPRLLLCSGLPRASLLTMIDRLGRLGQRAPDMTATYLELMVPSASSHWDIGRIGTKRQISRKLLGRLTSYMGLHGIDVSDNSTEVSTTFIKWLSQTYLGDEAKSKGKEKNSSVKVRSPLVFSSKMATSELDDTLDVVLPFQVKKESNKWIVMDQKVQKIAVQSTVVSISKGVEQGDVNVVNAILASMLDKSQSEMCDCATELVRCVYKEKQVKENNLSLLLKWVPLLTKAKGTPELWKAVFSLSVSEKVSSSLVIKATESWTSSHQSECMDWICKEMAVANDAAVHIVNVVRFLINTIPVPFGSPAQMTSPPNQRTFDAQAIEGMINIALFCLKCAASIHDSHAALGFDFGLWVSSLGKSPFESVTRNVIAEIKADTDLILKPVFSSFFLRLYLKHSLWLDLNPERTRRLLMKASELFQEQFSEWVSSLDDKINEVIESISSGQFRSIKILNDMARRHPLIVLRRGKDFALLLEHDASNTERDNGTRGMVHGEGFDYPLEAHYMNTNVFVIVRHWGYSYTESVWAAFLDIISSVPKDVLFGGEVEKNAKEFIPNLLICFKLFSNANQMNGDSGSVQQ
ncbi:hypothetical protein FisN_13Lh110 [Fistulifera solaris]|uniref:Uncharacterized protein n=1 Tax=Fistulifera solaris TaxID=1519565 RepID=A0A1Z5JFG9_FISSO|nr:hypothetical protein FisN_13Lh110 [Fistulifera solaris]|eukprot:GAX12642.1 hypothetical protein FisN_13Lh110 [Fistulifera solaris]